MHRAVLPLLLVSAALVGACTRAPAPEEPVRAVRTLTVQPVQAGGAHEYAAEVRARTESRLGFRVGGKVQRRHVNLGDAVRPGQVLASLDPQDLRLGEEAARAAVAAAEVNAAQAGADYRRFKELRDQGFISTAELERRETAWKAAQSQLEQARAQAGVQVNQASYASLVADAAGVVTAVEAEPGTVVGAGTPIVRIAWDGPRDVVFSVPEDRVPAIRALLGRPDTLTVRLWGDPGTSLKAAVREVAAAADPATRTFLVKADAGRAALRLGQTAAVLVDLPAVEGVVRLPLPAVFEHQGRAAVWVLDPASMTVRVQPVAVAGADGNEVIVAGGLQPGQTVVTAGVHTLTPGQKVRRYAGGSVPPAAAATSGAGPAAGR
jgi:RND family efflux transporter MFP subunit